MILERVLYQSVTVLDILIALLVLLSGVLFVRWNSRYLRRSFRDKLSGDSLQLMLKLLRFGSILLIGLIVLPMVGINLSGLVLAGGITGVVLGFASQNIISHLISGIFLHIERPIKIGNTVEIDGIRGVVEDIKLMSTVLRTLDGRFVRIPNTSVFSGKLINLVSHEARRFEYIIGIRYDEDSQRAINILSKVIDDEPLALKHPKPDVFVHLLGASSVEIMIRVWSPTEEWWELCKPLLERLKHALDENNIEIPFPQRVVWQGQPKNP